MMKTKVDRRSARQAAVQMLFELDFNADTSEARIRAFLAQQLHFPVLEQFAWDLIAGVRAHREEIDALLADAAVNWTVERMSAVDRNVMRLCVFELRHTQTPPRVAINEALEICKEFSLGESTRFVNGVLDKIAGLKQAGCESAARPANWRPRDHRSRPADRRAPAAVEVNTASTSN